jgi:hypothetical protein
MPESSQPNRINGLLIQHFAANAFDFGTEKYSAWIETSCKYGVTESDICDFVNLVESRSSCNITGPQLI